MTKSDFTTANLLTRSIKSYFESLEKREDYLARTEFTNPDNHYHEGMYVIYSDTKLDDVIEGKVYSNEDLRTRLGEVLIGRILDRLSFRVNIICGLIGLAALLTGHNVIAIIVLGLALLTKWFVTTADDVDRDVYRYTPVLFVDDDGEEIEGDTTFMFLTDTEYMNILRPDRHQESIAFEDLTKEERKEILDALSDLDDTIVDMAETEDDLTQEEMLLTLAALIDEAEDEEDMIRVRSLRRIERYMKGNV